MKKFLGIVFSFYCLVLIANLYSLRSQNINPEKGQKSYVGSKACLECHEEQYEKFHQYAKKAKSFESIKKMKGKLTQGEFRECFHCHTTGYQKPGGFRSEIETPHLKNAGCEVCHGPGSLHVNSNDAKDIKGKLTDKDCITCHNPQRVISFNYKPLIYGGAH